MSASPIGVFEADGVKPLTAAAFREAVMAEIETARARLWLSFFLVALEAADRTESVRFMLDALARAVRRHVDVRLIVDDFRLGPSRFRANAGAAEYLTARGVPVRVFVSERGRASHSKYVIRDEDSVIVGSGNLTPGGLDENSELALQAFSPDLTRELARRFEAGWAICTPWETSLP